MPRKLDPMWEYGDPEGGFNRQALYCKLCKMRMLGGITRLKYHLARIPGHEVEICKDSTPEIMHIANKALEELEATRDYNKAKKAQFAKTGGISEEGSSVASIPPSTSSYFVSRTTPGAQPSIKSMVKQKEKEEADKLVGKCFLWSDIPFNIAKNNPFYQPMFDAVAIVGPGYKAPTYEELRGPILQNEKIDCASRLEELKASWEVTGCTVMSDGWTDQKGRTLLNFLVNCPRGSMFVKSVDASAHVKDATLLCDLLDEFIREVGPQHVVQVITDNAANYVAAGRMLMQRYPTLFWTPCAAHCIDLILEDMGKIPYIRDIVESAKSITKFIYNHSSVLSMMRRFTNNRELVRPAITRFATSFISLRSILVCMRDLKTMFVSHEWDDLSLSRKPEGEAICRLVSYQESFWVGMEEVVAISEPLVKVLRLVDGDKPTMGYLYEAMDRAKEAIRAYYDDSYKGDDGFQKQLQIWGVIDQRWNNTLHRPIHAAGIYLNPAFSYSCGFRFDVEVMEGFLTCVERMVLSHEERAEISKEMEIYRMSGGTFGFQMAIADRKTKMPDAWWTSYGGRVPHLQKLAIRVLSQTCSSSGCERNWSAFDKIYTKKRNRLESQRLNDMVYVYYNLRLLVRQMQKTPDVDAISLDGIDTSAEWRVESERPILESMPDWIQQEVEGAVAEEEEEVEGDVTEQSLPPSSRTRTEGVVVGSSTSRGHQSLAPASSTGRQSQVPTPGASSSRGKAITFSRKRSRGNH